MARGKTAHQSDIERAIKVLTKTGQGVAAIVCLPGGGVEIRPGPLTPADASPQPAPPADELAAFRERKHARRAAQGSE